MAIFCIPAPTTEKLKAAVKSGDISIKDLYQATSEERRVTFETYASKELSREINAAFEKAMVSKQKQALTKWAEAVFQAKEKNNVNYKNVLDKIAALEKVGVLNPTNAENFLSDLVADQMGVSVTQDEVRKISEKAQELEKVYSQKTEDGLPPVDYWVKRRDMEKFLYSLSPSHQLKVATSLAGRGAMLFSFKSPLTNIISNTVQGLFEGFQRRVANQNYQGLNSDFAFSYIKKVNDIYQKSGYDISRMETISQGQKRLGEDMIHSEGPGVVRMIGRFYEDIVFKQLMGAPDVVSSSIAFADSANLASTKIAQMEGLSGEQAKARALEVFKDAILIKPMTVKGEIVRSQAIADAQYSTYTNKSGYSDLAMAIRTSLNNATGDMRLGDQLMPFVKTPANVVQATVDASGVGIFKGFWKLPEAIRQMKLDNPAPMREAVTLFTRGGFGMVLATVLAFAFRPDDFVGEYDALSQKERNLARLKNAPFNSVKIGDRYISLDYLGPLASPFVGIMYARKYGDTLPTKIFQYARGVGTQAIKVPGLREFSDLVADVSDSVKKGNLGDVANGLTAEAVAYIRARTIPAIVNDFAKGTDPNERDAGRDPVSKVKASIPGIRQSLPERVDKTSGETVKGEGLISTLLFGNRVKTANENAAAQEIIRLYGEDAGPTISDIEYSSKRVKELKAQSTPNKYEAAIRYFGRTFGEEVQSLLKDSGYQEATNEEKRDMINRARKEALEDMLDEYGYVGK